MISFSFFCKLKQLHEKEMDAITNNDRAKTEYEKRISRIQKEINLVEDYKSKITELEIKIKSNFLFSEYEFCKL